MAASRDRRASIIDDEAEDVDEVTLDAAHEKGLRKVQVSTWLLFEDSTSSVAAKVVQGVLMLLILISTVNMLVESHTACRFEVRSEPPAANAGLGTSHYQRTCDEVRWSPLALARARALALALALAQALAVTRSRGAPSRPRSSRRLSRRAAALALTLTATLTQP